jgi:transposase
VFTKNRERLLDGVVAEEFFNLVIGQARAMKLLSDEHFTVDGTLIETWAGPKSFLKSLMPVRQCSPAENVVLTFARHRSGI